MLPAIALLALLAGALLLPGGAGRSAARHQAAPLAATWGFSALPLSARGPVSLAVGRDDRAYRVRGSGAQLRARNPAQRLSARFTPAGVRVAGAGAKVGMNLRAIGYGTTLQTLPATAPRRSANGVLYSRSGVSEWYANSPVGLEQGFSVAAKPPGSGTLTLALALSGNAHASLAGAGQSVVFSRAGKPVLRYGGLLAGDARGRTLRSRLSLADGQILLRVDTRGARFPLRIDPWFEQAQLSAGYGNGGTLFGYSVALSADGNTALVGGPRDHNHVGAAWVFARSGETWAQQSPKLTGSEEAGTEVGEEGEEGAEEGFGSSVALSADGNTALIGAPRQNGKVGAAWVFTRSGSTWSTQGQQLTALGEVGLGRFGRSVALSADGSTALVGGSGDSSGHGAVWAFTRAGPGYSQQAKLTASDRVGEAHLGRSVALSADGNTALVGGPGEDGGSGESHYVGAAWVFVRSGGWAQAGEKLIGAGELGEGHFGRSVALSADGATALIGGFDDNQRAGAAWVFAREGQSFGQQGAKLTAGGEAGEGLFGFSVALTADGNTALIGGYGQESHAGAAWTFSRSGSSWSQQGAPVAAPAMSGKPWFGFSVALAGDGATALVGAPVESSKAGSARVLVTTPPESPPVNTEAPAIIGITANGQALACLSGAWTGSPPPTFSYQWQRDGSAIAGAQEPIYVVQGADEGHTLTCVVTAASGSFTRSVTSGAVAIASAFHPSPGAKVSSGSGSAGGGVKGFHGSTGALPAPIFGRNVNLLPTTGVVLVKLPGSNRFVRVTSGMSVPLGTVVDATRGRVELISAADVTSKTDESGSFYAGVFRIGQVSAPSALKGGQKVAITVLTLAGPRPSGCKARRARHASVAAKRRSRRLWGNAKGNFTTSGRYASATVRGTQWLTEDTCAGTLVRVVSGIVSVTDFAHHRSFLIKASKHFLAHPGRGG